MNNLKDFNTEPVNIIVNKIFDKLLSLIPEPVNTKHNLKKQDLDSELKLRKLEKECGLTREQAQHYNWMVERDQRKLKNYLGVVANLAGENIDLQLIDNVDLDWLNLHYEKSSMYSNTDLQVLWGKILAGEINHPGKYSKQVLSILDLMSPHDAEVFEKLLSFLFYINGSPHIFLHDKSVFSNLNIGFTYNDLIQLQGLGLISIDSSAFGSGSNPDLQFDSSSPIKCRYFHKEFEVLPKSNNQGAFNILGGIVNLTSPGKEILGICAPTENQNIFAACVEYWKKGEYQIINYS